MSGVVIRKMLYICIYWQLKTFLLYQFIPMTVVLAIKNFLFFSTLISIENLHTVTRLTSRLENDDFNVWIEDISREIEKLNERWCCGRKSGWQTVLHQKLHKPSGWWWALYHFHWVWHLCILPSSKIDKVQKVEKREMPQTQPYFVSPLRLERATLYLNINQVL